MGRHSSSIRSELEATFVGKTFWLCLADSATLTEFSPASDFFARELPIGTNGYSRKSLTITGPSIIDNATKIASLPMKTTTWTPVGGSLQFQTVFMISGGATGTTGTIELVHVEPVVILRQAGQPFNFELTLRKTLES
jgi:hypothetical protein